MKYLLTIPLMLMLCISGLSQGLEGIIVETYYISNANDATDTDGGSLAVGSTTYRIFVDMAPGYEIQAVYGNANHELRIATTTQFFNNVDRGELTGNAINDARVDENTVALDSWLSMGPATDAHFGVLKTEDTNGSIVGGVNNDGGSANIPGGLLVNADPLAGIPLTSADGLIAGVVPSVTFVGINPTMFDNFNSGLVFTTNSGAWSVLEGVVGPTSTNRVLIAQITTNGQLSFELNIQLGAPGGGVEKYVAENPQVGETLFAQLTYPVAVTPGCTNPAACNYSATAGSDDGSCIIPVPNCQVCNATNTGLVIVDTDGDGVCNAQEVSGCTSSTACNFNPAATDNNGSCVFPVANCQTCLNGGLVIVDSDGDGVCDAQEVPGCTNPSACNFNPAATDNNGSCIIPLANCQVCNASNTGLVIVDADGDGVCNAQEVPGCTDPAALNYNPAATDENGTCSYAATPGCTNSAACNFNAFATVEDGSCIIPVPDCTACNANNTGLVPVDADSDGVCDAEEVPGCTDENACNYSSQATDDNGTCVVPTSGCTVCNGSDDGLDIVDSDGDGVCDGEEVDGCTNSAACNFMADATEDDGTCIVPVPNCTVCNANNTGLVLVDADNDGVCDAEEIAGCLSPTACNYNPDATDVVPCIEPEANCQECNVNGTGLVFIDADGDGVCNAEEVSGCTNPAAINYDPDATDDDGSCEFEPGTGCGGGLGLEGIIVERYYVADSNDAADEDGGSELAEGSVTYRVYADLAVGYELQAVYGNALHLLRIETSTYFYNNADRGEATGDQLPANRLDENTVALDSYVTVGGASTGHWGILKSEDIDGSVVGGSNNDGGSEGIAGGLLVNDDPLAGIPLTEADGLLAGTVPAVTVVGLDLSIFDNSNGGPLFLTNGGAWSVLEGTQGPTSTNKVLIAQLTTDGNLEFELNIQLGTPEGGVEKYVASNAVGNEFQCDQLIYPALSLAGCTDILATNFNPDATVDNGSCQYDFAICDCNQEEFSPATRFELGNGTANNDGPGGSPDFDCWAWAFDCGDIAGSPAGDPFGVCTGNLPLENNCGIMVNEQDQSGVRFYPNPSDGRLLAEFSGFSGPVEVRLFDQAARLIQVVPMQAGQGRVPLDLSAWPAGIYHVQATSNAGVFNERLVIQR